MNTLQKTVNDIFEDIRVLESYIPNKHYELKKFYHEVLYKFAVLVENLEFHNGE